MSGSTHFPRSFRVPLSCSLFRIAPIYDANTGWTVSCDSSTNPVVICSLLLTQQLSDVCRRLRSSQLNPPIPFPRSSCLLNCGGLRNIRNTERLYVRWCSGTKLPCMLSECCCQHQRRVSKQTFCMTPKRDDVLGKFFLHCIDNLIGDSAPIVSPRTSSHPESV